MKLRLHLPNGLTRIEVPVFLFIFERCILFVSLFNTELNDVIDFLRFRLAGVQTTILQVTHHSIPENSISKHNPKITRFTVFLQFSFRLLIFQNQYSIPEISTVLEPVVFDKRQFFLFFRPHYKSIFLLCACSIIQQCNRLYKYFYFRSFVCINNLPWSWANTRFALNFDFNRFNRATLLNCIYII